MLLTVTELRTFITTSLSDAAVALALDAAEADLGSMEAVTERKGGGFAALVLDRRVGTISTVKEDIEETSPLTLASDDYRVDGYILHRLDTGTNPRTTWDGEVEVIHTPADDLAERKRAQVALLRLDISGPGGITSERIGDYAVGYKGSSDYQAERAAILAPFRPAMVR